MYEYVERTATQKKQITSVASNKLPQELKSGIEGLSGLSMDAVRVHYNSTKPAALSSYAYAKGTNIHIAPGQEKYLPHEAWHVVQQMRGKVISTLTENGENINDSPTLEHEADVMGAKAAKLGQTVQPKKDTDSKLHNAIVQRILGNNTVQKKPINIVTNINSTSNLPTLTPNAKPTIVFEGMGQNIADAESIYNETKKYSGNTICVFGLNERKNTVQSAQVNAARAGRGGAQVNVAHVGRGGAQVNVAHAGRGGAQIAPARPQWNTTNDKNEQPHFLRGFSFNWEKPSQVAEGAGYSMPFIDARYETMKQAKNFADAIKPNYTPANNDDNAGKFIFRWIDADAKDDTSDDIEIDTLLNIADNNISVLSGVYGWRSQQAGNDNMYEYTEFLNKINESEQAIRYKFFELYGKLADSFNFSSNLPVYLNSENGLNDYYLPETTLMMSEYAHNTVISGVNDMARIQDELLEGKTQQKESMRMLKESSISRGMVAHDPKLKVTKPLKNDLTPLEELDRGQSNYLGEKMLNLLKNGTDPGYDKFAEALMDMRQSVFKMFNISGCDDFNEFKLRQLHYLYTYFLNARRRIEGQMRRNRTDERL